MLGKLLDGRYQIVQVLGAGGFGETYVARDTRRPGNPTCVVKHLKPVSRDPQSLPTARRLFNSEAETLERLGRHDQIPRLLAYFEEDREFYLVQDYVEGHNLSTELVSDRPWREEQVVQLLEDVLPILTFVHSQGVIHRDLKPDNLLRRREDGKLVLVDFGAVKQMTTQMVLAPEGAANHTVAVGTPGYMPSEQAKGQPRLNSDLYALGVIALQALTGVNPAQFQYDPQTLEIVWQPLAAVSPGLAAILSRMVKYHFGERYQSAREILQELQPLAPSPYSAPNLLPPQTEQTLPPPDYSTPFSEQKTYAVGGLSPATTSHSPETVVPPQPVAPRKGKDRLPLVAFGSVLAVSFAIALGVSAIVRNWSSTPNTIGFPRRNTTAETDGETCSVVLNGTLNVRSAPSGSVINSVSRGTKLSLTGEKKNGWVEIRQPVQGWVFNDAKYIKCPVTRPSPTPSEPSPTPKAEDRGKQILAAARQKYESGDLTSAIAQLKSIPRTSEAFSNAQKALSTWRNVWSQAQTQYNQAQKAFEQGKWDDVLAYVNDQSSKHPYWRKKLQELGDRARQRKAEEVEKREESKPKPPVEPPQPSPAEPSPPTSEKPQPPAENPEEPTKPEKQIPNPPELSPQPSPAVGEE